MNNTSTIGQKHLPVVDLGAGGIDQTSALPDDGESDDSRTDAEVLPKKPKAKKPKKKKANSKPGQKRKYINDWEDEIVKSYDRSDEEDNGLLPYERDALREIRLNVCGVEDNLKRGYSPNRLPNKETSMLSRNIIKELVELREKILRKIPRVDDLLKDKSLQSCLGYIDRTLHNPNVCPATVDETGKQTWREILKEEDEGAKELSDIRRFRSMRKLGVRTVLQDSIKGMNITDNEVCVKMLHYRLCLINRT